MAEPYSAYAASVDDLAAYLRADPTDADLPGALAAARAELETVLESAWRPMPEVTFRRVLFEVAGEFYRRRDSPSGASQFAEFAQGAPVRSPRDPLAQSMPIIRRYVLGL